MYVEEQLSKQKAVCALQMCMHKECKIIAWYNVYMYVFTSVDRERTIAVQTALLARRGAIPDSPRPRRYISTRPVLAGL